MFSLWRFASITILSMVATKLTKQRWAMRCVCCLWRVSGFYTETSRWLQKCIWPQVGLWMFLFTAHTEFMEQFYYAVYVVWCLQQIFGEHTPLQTATFPPPLVNRARNRNFSFATGVWLLNTTACWHQNSQDHLRDNSVLGFLKHADTVALQTEREHPGKKTNCATMFTNLSIQCKIKENCEIMYHQKDKWDL